MLSIDDFDDLSDRKVNIVNHFYSVMDFDLTKMNYIRTEKFATDLYSIDVAVFAPTKNFNYYVMTTVGLSEYYFPKRFGRVELTMVLPPNWKPDLDKEEYWWPYYLLLDIAYQIAKNKFGVNIGQVYVFNNEDEKSYSNYTDAIGGIICMPELFPLEIFETPFGGSTTKIFQVMSLNKTAVSKLDSMGSRDYILYELHDSDNALMVIPFEEKQLNGIDKIIRKNESNLKS